MKDFKETFYEWLDGIMRGLNLEPAAYCFNIYENSDGGDYSLELAAFDEYDPYDADWCCGGCEIYASRNDDNELNFELKGGWQECLTRAGEVVADYLNDGQFASKLKNARIVAYGFVDGDLETAYEKNE